MFPSRAQIIRNLPRLLVSFALSISLLLIAITLSRYQQGGKHFVGLIVCFPFGSLVGLLFPYGARPLTALMWLLLMVQLPVYSLILNGTRNRKHLLWRVILLIILHTLFVLLCFMVKAIYENKG